MKIDIQLSKKISVLSVFWMIAIVLFHSSHGVRAVWYSELMSDCRLAGVGFFFAVSGFFLMRKDAWGGGKGERRSGGRLFVHAYEA